MIQRLMQNNKLIYNLCILRNKMIQKSTEIYHVQHDERLVLYSPSLSRLPLPASILSASRFRLPPQGRTVSSLPPVCAEPSRRSLKPPSVSALHPDYKAERQCTLSSARSVAYTPQYDLQRNHVSVICEVHVGLVLILLPTKHSLGSLFAYLITFSKRLRPKSRLQILH